MTTEAPGTGAFTGSIKQVRAGLFWTHCVEEKKREKKKEREVKRREIVPIQ